ncbi:hypothetical protein BP5796_03143 [Coleophoma crateriformis]|uniref:Cytochrome P450 monooxygenase ABA1 n=1 Tax=Coleophoma crateriformis TaxID=565419 RepID=A0A3D8SM77_9HELO|nr:hypothetical protein BP5796_03143 [Coleophoma crateriformis]
MFFTSKLLLQVVGLAVAGYVVRLWSQYNRLKAFKGPLGTGFTNLWLVKAVLGLNTHLEYYNVCKKYGPLSRVGPDTLITDSPELLIRMNAARSAYTKGAWYKGNRIQPGHDNVFSMLSETGHAQRRSQMAAGYSGKENLSLENSVDTHVQSFIRLIRKKYISNNKGAFKPMDLARKAQFFTLDVITDVAFGQPFGDLEQDEDIHKYIQSTEEMLQVIILMGTIPAVSDIVQSELVGTLLFPSGKESTGIGRLIGIAQQIVGERFSASAQAQPDMLGSFIRHGLNEEQLVSESLMQILAGGDTSATAIRATMLHLMTNRRSYEALRDEIDTAVRAGKISSPVIKDVEGQALPYLQAVIKEGMRIWPPVTGLLSKKAPPEGDTVEILGKTYFIPGNTNVGYCAWGVMHSTDVFGEDADVFRPERWLEPESEKLSRMHKTVELAWGHGKYQCLGKNVAMIELNKVFVELLRNFDFEIIDPTNPWKSGNVGLWMQSELWVRVLEREHS